MPEASHPPQPLPSPPPRCSHAADKKINGGDTSSVTFQGRGRWDLAVTTLLLSLRQQHHMSRNHLLPVTWPDYRLQGILGYGVQETRLKEINDGAAHLVDW